METGKCLRYAFYLIFHPFDGFWDIKYEKRGNMKAAFILLFLGVLVYVAGRQFTGFLFNYVEPESLNLFVDAGLVLALFFLWCTANWCLTSLMDGKGSYRDIMKAAAYAMTPWILLSGLAIGLSGVFTLQEGTFYYIVQNLGYLWSAGLLFFGMMVTHEYSFWKNFACCIMTLIGMAVIVFIILLFFSVIQQAAAFFMILYRELSLRG